VIYGVTGMPLAGKTTVAGLLEDHGFEVIDMGDVVRKELEKRDIPAEKTGEFVNNQREEKGMDAIAQLTVPYIEEASEKVVITGMRGLGEKERFEDRLDEEVEMIAVWASKTTRKRRREERMRDEDLEGDEFEERDMRELENGVGRLMALSDHMIINEGLELDGLKKEVTEIVR
jgi:dephospho-CoA kinase